VRSLSGGALRRRWQAVFGRSPPEHFTADLLRRMIANRVQEEPFGTLDRATLKLPDGFARRGGSRPAERNLKIGTCMGQVGLEWQVAGFGDFSSRSGERRHAVVQYHHQHDYRRPHYARQHHHQHDLARQQ
jgi:hypothetical protein